MSTDNTAETTVTQEIADSGSEPGQRRNIHITDDTWTGIGLISAKTGFSKSSVVEKALSDFVERELPRLFSRTSSAT